MDHIILLDGFNRELPCLFYEQGVVAFDFDHSKVLFLSYEDEGEDKKFKVPDAPSSKEAKGKSK
jgi:hypothetical protein